MYVLVVNAGSSSLKFQCVHAETGRIIDKGLCERIGDEGSTFTSGLDEKKSTVSVDLPDHVSAINAVLDCLTNGEDQYVKSLDDIDAVGHRIVHGGSYFSESCIIDEDVIAKIDELAELAPLHNKAAIACIRACEQLIPGTPNVAVFDTAFFQSIPPKAFMYPLPYEYYEKYGIRKYGAHGTSHRYIAYRAARLLDEPLDELKLITCHLGNGCSITAIDHGKAIDTSMGFTPLDGCMMGTRCGSIDPAIVPFLMKHENLNEDEIDLVLNKKSGLLGITGYSNDLRTITEEADKGDQRAALAYEMFAHSVKKIIGSYAYLMAGIDGIVLTAGIGENSRKMRSMIFAGMQRLGVIIDEKKNKMNGFERIISSPKSKVSVMVIPTDEEYMIARDTYELVSKLDKVETLADF